MTTTPTITERPLTTGTWTLDPSHSAMTFSIRHLGISKVRGRFDRFDATLEVGPASDDIRVTATVDLRLGRHQPPRP